MNLPWSGYNSGEQFVCNKCGARFDTSAGIALHQVYGCNAQRIPAPVVNKTLPSCPACGSFAVYCEKDGSLRCQTCTICGLIIPKPKKEAKCQKQMAI